MLYMIFQYVWEPGLIQQIFIGFEAKLVLRKVGLPQINSIVLFSDPYRKFNIFVKAFNAKNEGNASEDIQVNTFLSCVTYDYIHSVQRRDSSKRLL